MTILYIKNRTSYIPYRLLSLLFVTLVGNKK